MASIDDLFKKPSASGKRKLEAARDPDEIYKSIKLASNGDAKGKDKAATVDDDDDDMEAGPAPPDDEDYGPDIPDDEEGRFFGGGISKDEADILDFMDEQDAAGAPAEVVNSKWLRKTALNFEKRISKNAELRAKFEDDPTKFMTSEADLDADIKALSILSEHPELYAEFAKLGCVNSLVGLLSHENADIAIDAIEIISELTDEDVEAEQEQWNVMVDALLDADVLGLMFSLFDRLNEQNEADRNGVYHILSVVENLASQETFADKIGAETSFLTWLLQRAAVKEAVVSQNKQYAAEVLAILLQTSTANRRLVAEADGVDALLQLLAPYRKRDPAKGTDEEEFVENIFASLTCVVEEPAGKATFVDAEGVELCLIMLREGKLSKPRALRVLDHATGGATGGAVCVRVVDAAGLKVLFRLFMKQPDAATTEHLLGIFASLLRSLPPRSAERIRALAKFVEKDYEKLAALVKLRREFAARDAAVVAQMTQQQQQQQSEDVAAEWLSRRLDAGLFSLQTVDVILAWMVAEDDGARTAVVKLLADRDETLAVIRATIHEQLQGLEGADDGEEKTTKDMLSTLIEFLT